MSFASGGEGGGGTCRFCLMHARTVVPLVVITVVARFRFSLMGPLRPVESATGPASLCTAASSSSSLLLPRWKRRSAAAGFGGLCM